MRKRVLAVVLIAFGLAGGTAVVAAADPPPGPIGPNNWGLCNAYGRGSDTGQANKHNAPPFVALKAAADAANQSVEDWCAANGQKPGGGGS